jgi:hypothetical protein
MPWGAGRPARAVTLELMADECGALRGVSEDNREQFGYQSF